VSGTYTEFIYSPTGAKVATANGQTLVKALIALPGGAKVIYNSSGLAYYRHSDWLGSSRLTSTPSRTMYSDSAYAPFGEQYATSGSTDASFTGQEQDTANSLYDFPARRYSYSQGRWISPDPLGRGAVTLTNPQSWNRYVYVLNNPLKLIDRVGFCGDDDDDSSSGDDDDDDDGGGEAQRESMRGGHSHLSQRPHANDCGGDDDDDNSGGDNNSNNCDAQCQDQQAELAALMAVLTNTNCAALIGGPSASGQAAAAGAIAGQLFGNPNPFIQFNAGPDSSVPSNAYATTNPASVPVNLGGPTPVLMPGVQITLGQNFYNPPAGAVLPPGGVAQNQENTILEEFGHAEGFLAAGGYGYPDATGIMMDNSTNLSNVSIQNGQNVQAACDQGGNVPTQTSQLDETIQ